MKTFEFNKIILIKTIWWKINVKPFIYPKRGIVENFTRRKPENYKKSSKNDKSVLQKKEKTLLFKPNDCYQIKHSWNLYNP